MDVKKLLKVLFITVLVPGGSLVGAYYLAQFGKKKYDQWKAKKDEPAELILENQNNK